MKVRVLAAVVGVLMLSASAASAQGFVRVLGGVTFGSETSSVIGGGFGVRIGENLLVTGELGRFQNVLPKALQEDLDFVARQIEFETGLRATLDVQVPALYGMGGVRVNVPMMGRVRPFVEGSAGFASISFDVDANIGGIDISELITDEVGAENETKFLVAFGGGIDAALTEAIGVDVGYRYHRIFTGDPAINTSALYAALRFGF
jgi:opacity protein-like surface antigen